ncbi:MAG: hypothetical protein E4H14_05790 [Candidatus Thorarchaeota archaeon]|nr:MAG: hypothetical protein E4H14_05790 [Candidatus Thorarchaeota archaeon]
MPHDPGIPLNDDEFDEVCRWMTAESNKRIRMLCADLTKEQAIMIHQRMNDSTLYIGPNSPNRIDEKRKKLM